MNIDSENAQKFSVQATVPETLVGQRLDQAAAELFSDYSRGRLQQWIKSGHLLVDGKTAKTRDKLYGGEKLTLQAEVEEQEVWQAEDIPLDIVYEDDHLLVLNKPVGLVVHPAVGNRSGTVLNGLLYHAPELEKIPRAGIVHRLDKDTSGLMVVAKTLQSHNHLIEQLQHREVNREYEAVVIGVVTAGGTVEASLGRHPVERTKRAVSEAHDSKPAVTHYRVLEKFRSHTHIQCKLETGRTHQIRVHMSYKGFPLVGDPTYGGRFKLPKGASKQLIDFLQSYKHQALHARRLGFIHPASLDYVEWEAELPDDMQALLKVLAEDMTWTTE